MTDNLYVRYPVEMAGQTISNCAPAVERVVPRIPKTFTEQDLAQAKQAGFQEAVVYIQKFTLSKVGPTHAINKFLDLLQEASL